MEVRRCRTVELNARQAFHIYGFAPKRTIDWATVLNTDVCLRKLLDAGLTLDELKKIQPWLSEWYKCKKAVLLDLATLTDWDINIPTECPTFCLIDCIHIGVIASASRMVQMGLTLTNMCSLYGLQYKQMAMMQKNMSEWVIMGFDFDSHGRGMDEQTFMMVFGMPSSPAYALYCNIQQHIAASSGTSVVVTDKQCCSGATVS